MSDKIMSVSKTNNGADPSSSSEYVRVKFVNQDNEETYFRVLRKAKLEKAIAAYSRHHNLDYHVDITFNGERVNPNYSCLDLEIENGDVFDVFKHVHGGA